MSLDLVGALKGGYEDFAPENLAGRLAEVRRMAAYTWAASFAGGRRVLDANAQLGYGTALLASQAQSVAGVVAAEPLAEAARQQLADDVTLSVTRVDALPFAAQTFDLVVFLAERPAAEEGEAVLQELRRVLAPDGLALLSADEALSGQLRALFRNVRTTHVRAMLAACVPDGDVSKAAVQRLAMDEPRSAELALCSDGVLPGEAAAIVLAGPLGLDDWMARAERQVAQIEKLSRELEVAHKLAEDRSELGRRLLDAEAKLASLPTLTERNEALVDAQAAIQSDRDEAVGLAEAQRQGAERALQAMRGSLSWRLTTPLRALARRSHR